MYGGFLVRAAVRRAAHIDSDQDLVCGHAANHRTNITVLLDDHPLHDTHFDSVGTARDTLQPDAHVHRDGSDEHATRSPTTLASVSSTPTASPTQPPTVTRTRTVPASPTITGTPSPTASVRRA
ncbi:MAG: hypothetical protein U0802_07695 [Candidatus Binatia bacterium]